MQSKSMAILLIEDDPAEAELIRETLSEEQKRRFSMEHALSLAEGLDLLKRRSFDCVLVDLGLPDSQGLESVLAVRNLVKHTPVVIMTALDDEETALKALQMDIQDYLVKGEISGALLSRSIRYAVQRKQIEEELRVSESRYLALYRDNPAMILTLNADGKILSLNPACTAQLGYAENDLEGRAVLDIFHPDDRPVVMEQLRNCVRFPNNIHKWQFRKISKGGDLIWVEEMARVVYDLNGAMNILIVCRDITDHIKLEEALRKSENKFQKIFNAVPALVGISTVAEGRFVNVNETCERVLGYRRDELIGRTSLELDIWKRKADRKELVRILQEQGSVRDYEVRFRDKNGEIHTGLLNAEYIDFNGDRYMLSLLMDITERKKLEEVIANLNRQLNKHAVELERANHELQVHQIELETQNDELRRAQKEADDLRERYQDLYDFAPIGYFTLDEKGLIMEANHHGASFFAMERGNLVNHPFSLLLGQEWKGEFRRFLLRVFSGETRDRCEVRIGEGNAKGRWVIIEGVVAGRGDKKRSISRVALMDITERKGMEEEIMRLNGELASRAVELEAVNKDLEAFNYTVAHDLRRPLTNINGYCQIIEEVCGGMMDETCRGYLRETYNGTLTMNQHITALLDFSMLAHAEPRRETVDLSGLANAVAAELAIGRPVRRTEFRVGHGITAIGDAKLLRLVLENLMGNAWKYTSELEDAVIEFGATGSGDTRAFFVRDNGPGFSQVDAERIFIPFHRLPGAEEHKGFGIGLATVKRIIQRHDGRIWAEGVPGKGAAFFFTLPEVDSRADSPPSPKKLPAGRGEKP